MEAALAATKHNVSHPERIALLLQNIEPGLRDIPDIKDVELSQEAQLAAAVEANVRWSIKQVRDTPEGKARLEEGVIKLVGAVYELNTGRVRFLP